jgi:hypothetical protein
LRHLLPALAFVSLLAPISARAHGTYFLLEFRPGTAALDGYAGEDWGYGGEAALGAGLRLPGTPLRIYALGSAGWFGSTTQVAGPMSSATLDRSVLRLAVGPRLLVPVAGRMRVFLDVAASRTYVDSEVVRNGVERYLDSSEAMSVLVGGGLQYRFSRAFSAGVLVSRSFDVEPDGFDFAAEAAGLAQDGSAPGLTTVSLTAGVHF